MTDQKLALKQEFDKIDDKTKIFLNETLLKYGRLSIPYLIRKLKCTEERAKSLIHCFFAS